MIYDHYLITREWTPNFHPNNATIEKAAVWVRIPDLPIEYYDAKILHFIGNRIGKTVKVDRNTLFQERGKYARVCVEVELNKPLLAMFELKDLVYKVEYEGLHMLCRNCGRFGHYLEGCPEKNVAKVNPNVTGSGEVNTTMVNAEGGRTDNIGENVAGPWVVVHKPRRGRKGKDGTSKEALPAGNNRFELLDSVNEDSETNGENNAARTVQEITTNIVTNTSQNNGRGHTKSGRQGSEKRVKAVVNMEKMDGIEKNTNHVALGGSMLTKGGKHNETTNNGKLIGRVSQGNLEGGKEVVLTMEHSGLRGTINHDVPLVGQLSSLKGNETHHMTRPPDQNQLGCSIPHSSTIGPQDSNDKVNMPKRTDEDMEIVPETPNLTQQEGGTKTMILD
jgi:hypothetical protein